MRALRPALCLLLAGSLVGAGAADAAVKKKKPAPKPVCNLITDATGDAPLLGPDPSDDSLDIVSGDVASSSKVLTGVVRLKNVSGGTLSPLTGQTYYVQFNAPGFDNPLYVSYTADKTKTLFQYGDLETTQGQQIYTPKATAAGVVDAARNEIRISVPLADLASLATVKPGMKLTGIQALTFQNVGVPNAAGGGGLLAGGDTADTSKAYIAGAPSCVKPGA